MGQRVADEVVVHASGTAVYDVIADLAAYPEWAEDVVSVEVLEADDDGLPLAAAFEVDARIALVQYTLQYQHDRPDRVRWRLVEGELLHQLDGRYELEELGDDRTRVRYSLEASLAMPLPTFLQRRAARVILETGLDGLRNRVEGRPRRGTLT